MLTKLMKQYKTDLKNIQDGKLTSQDKLNISKVHRACNSIIFAINFITVDCLKLVNKINAVSIGKDFDSDESKAKRDNYVKKREEETESEIKKARKIMEDAYKEAAKKAEEKEKEIRARRKSTKIGKIGDRF